MSGYKTYISAAVIAVASVALALGWIDRTTYDLIVGLAGGAGLAALRMGVKKDVDKSLLGISPLGR